MKKYRVAYEYSTKYYIDVEAENEEKARLKADEKLSKYGDYDSEDPEELTSVTVKEIETEPKKYWVIMSVDGRYETLVEAVSAEEAKQKAEQKFMDADVGDLEIVDTGFATIQDEKGNYYD